MQNKIDSILSVNARERRSLKFPSHPEATSNILAFWNRLLMNTLKNDKRIFPDYSRFGKRSQGNKQFWSLKDQLNFNDPWPNKFFIPFSGKRSSNSDVPKPNEFLSKSLGGKRPSLSRLFVDGIPMSQWSYIDGKHKNN